jgi:hypothetical protein
MRQPRDDVGKDDNTSKAGITPAKPLEITLHEERVLHISTRGRAIIYRLHYPRTTIWVPIFYRSPHQEIDIIQSQILLTHTTILPSSTTRTSSLPNHSIPLLPPQQVPTRRSTMEESIIKILTRYNALQAAFVNLLIKLTLYLLILSGLCLAIRWAATGIRAIKSENARRKEERSALLRKNNWERTAWNPKCSTYI